MDVLLEVQGARASPVPETSLNEAGLWERAHLQEWVVANPAILGPDVLVVTVEYDRWAAEADGAPARDRLDVLGLDSTGRLVVVEIKRGDADRDIHLQAITYAALVSRFTPDTLAMAYREFRAKRDGPLDLDRCKELLLEHVGGEWDPELLRRPRQVLIARSFPKQVTHTVVWLSEMNLDIDLVQVNLWRMNERLLAGFTKVYPTPEAEEFTLAPAREDSGAAIKKAAERSRAKNVAHVLVEGGLLPDGTRLKLAPNHGTTDGIREAIRVWVAEQPSRGTATWRNVKTRPLVWDFDEMSYSSTGLANHVFSAVTDKKPDGIQGTTWWVVDGDHVPAGVDPADWLEFADRNLVQLASSAGKTGRNWDDLHTLLSAIPPGRWTTYGDVAAAIGSHAVPVGSHLASCGQCSNAWRVLTAKGTISSGFRWSNPTRTENPADLLIRDGVRMTDGVADPAQRLSRAELEQQ